MAKFLQEYHITATLWHDILSRSLQPSAPFLHYLFDLQRFLLKATSKPGPPSFRKDGDWHVALVISHTQNTRKKLPVCCDASTNKTIFDLFSGPDELVSFWVATFFTGGRLFFICVCNCCCCLKRLATHSCNQTKQLKVLILSTEATCLREIFIKIFDLFISSQYFHHELFVMMWKYQKKVK